MYNHVSGNHVARELDEKLECSQVLVKGLAANLESETKESRFGLEIKVSVFATVYLL